RVAEYLSASLRASVVLPLPIGPSMTMCGYLSVKSVLIMVIIAWCSQHEWLAWSRHTLMGLFLLRPDREALLQVRQRFASRVLNQGFSDPVQFPLMVTAQSRACAFWGAGLSNPAFAFA